MIKSTIYILIIISTFYIWACGPRPMPLPQPVEFHPGNALFSKAEKMFRRKAYDNALKLYNEYISHFPNGYLTAEAMLKTAYIQTVLGKNNEARNIYNKVIGKYPNSFFALNARVEILTILFNEGRYKQVITRARNILKKTHSRTYMFKIYSLLGDSYLAAGLDADAFKSYLAAYKNAENEEKEDLESKIESAAMETDPKAIVVLLTHMENELPADEFIYKLALKKYEWKKYEDSISLLSEYIVKFPKHKNVEHAKNLIKKINETFTFKHYTLGCLLPLSGPYQAYGHKILNCIKLALSRFKDKNHPSSIRLVVKDTGSDPHRAALAVQKLSEERVGAIIGPVATNESAASVAQEKRIPIITLSQKENITNIGDYVFRNFITPQMQVKTIVSYAMDVRGLSRFVVLYPDEKYGITFTKLFQDEVNANGGEIIKVEPYRPDQTDFANPIKKLSEFQVDPSEYSDEKGVSPDLKQTKPVFDFDAIFIPDGPKVSGLILPQLAFYDITGVQLFGTNLWHSRRLIDMAQQFVQGAIMVDGFFAESNSKKVKDFVKLFEASFDEKPEFIDAVAYDTAMILFRLISRNDIQSRNQLKNEIMNLRNFQGLTGKTSFDNTGNAHKKLYLLQIKGNRFKEINAE